MKLSRKKTIPAITLLLFLTGMIVTAFYLKDVADYQKAVRETVLHDINLSNVPNGTYIGDYDVNFIYAKVEVTVQSGTITKIVLLEHKNERGQPAEAVIGRITEEQTTDVDAVSGATNSSTVIRKAVENALMTAPSPEENESDR